MGWSADLPSLFYPAMVLRNRRWRPLRVVIVERQNHALEHVHHALRRAASLTGGWTMVHFDSHPDLACPDPAHVCARACFELLTEHAPVGDGPARDLYDPLDASASGIAEWIVPLQLAGGLVTMDWRKPAWSDQFADGEYRYAVGAAARSGAAEGGEASSFLDLADDAGVAVTLVHPYYLEDVFGRGGGGAAPSARSPVVEDRSRLRLPQDVRLVVTTVEERGSALGAAAGALRRPPPAPAAGPWMLDVCLDHFVCSNPFLGDLRGEGGVGSDAFVRALRAVLSEFSCARSLVERSGAPSAKRSRTDGGVGGAVARLEDEITRFHGLLGSFLERAVCDDVEGELGLPPDIFSSEGTDPLCDAFERPDAGRKLLQDLSTALRKCGNTQATAVAAVKILPWVGLPHDDATEDGDDAVATRLGQFRADLHDLAAGHDSGGLRVPRGGGAVRAERSSGGGDGTAPPAPFLVTVARSVSDGYTSMAEADRLQRAVVSAVHQEFCGCSSHPEIWEGTEESKLTSKFFKRNRSRRYILQPIIMSERYVKFLCVSS